MIGQTVSHYRILAKLGGGGMGVVYRAEDVKLGRQVALKFLPPESSGDAAAGERFRREARAASALNHPHICTIYEIDSAGDRDFIAMELLEGDTVHKRLGEGGFSFDEVRALGRQFAEALEAAHARGILHRDVKPANLHVSADGRAKILDFGLAKRLSDEPAVASAAAQLTHSGALVGTIAYMSPEQARGEALDARSDVFSLGAVLYEMSTGFPAFTGDTAAVIFDAILHRGPMPPSQLRRGVPADLERVILRALEKDRERRFASAGELAQALAQPAAQRSAPERQGLLGRLLSFAVRRRRRQPEPAAPSAPSGSAAAARADRTMIAVLPFENLGAADDAYFAAGMTEEITSRLAAVRGLGVISRASAAAYDRSGRTLRDIGRDLGVRYVLDGTVRWQRGTDGASRVRVTPVLASVSEDTQLWSERYDRALDELFTVQSAIAEKVVEALNVTLLEPERAALEARPTENLDAYQAYLKGLEYLNRLARPEGDLRMSVRLFERAVELDAGFALAYAALSEAHAMLHHMRYDRSPERLAEARRTADRVLELKPDLAEGHLALGNYYFLGLKDHVAALAEFAIAERSMPDDPRLRASIGYALRLQGRFDEAARSLRRAFQLNPRDPDLAFEIALTYGGLRRYEDAERFCDRSIALAPDQAPAFGYKFFNRVAWRGSVSDAAGILEQMPSPPHDAFVLYARFWGAMLARQPERALAELASSPMDGVEVQHMLHPKPLMEGQALRLAGRGEEARAAFDRARERLERVLAERPEDPRAESSLGIALAGLGRAEEAIAHAERAAELYPLSLDAYVGAVRLEDLAHAHALLGHGEQAAALLERLLAMPAFISRSHLRVDPRWDGVREHPRFGRLAAEPAA